MFHYIFLACSLNPMTNFKPVFIAFSFILLSGIVRGAVEKREYDITVAGINIGEMVATRETRDDNLTYYSLKSKVSFWFFIRVNVEYSVASVYHKNHLISSTVNTTSNRGNFISTIQWDKDHYNVHVEGYKYKNEVAIGDTIVYNSARMYFEYPTVNSAVLADNYGLMVSTENLQKDVYAVTVEGNRNRFFFHRGKVIRAVMHHPIKNFEVTYKP